MLQTIARNNNTYDAVVAESVRRSLCQIAGRICELNLRRFLRQKEKS